MDIMQKYDPKPTPPTEIKLPVIAEERPNRSLMVTSSMPEAILKREVIKKVKRFEQPNRTYKKVTAKQTPKPRTNSTSRAPVRAFYKYKAAMNSFRPVAYGANLCVF